MLINDFTKAFTIYAYRLVKKLIKQREEHKLWCRRKLLIMYRRLLWRKYD